MRGRFGGLVVWMLGGAVIGGVAAAAESVGAGDTAAAGNIGVAGLFSKGLAPVDLGQTSDGERTAGACRGCHEEIWQEWAASRHGSAWTNGIFQREFRAQPLDWCVRCHAPLATGGGGAAAASVGAVEAEGVNCAVCHVRDGEVLAAEQRPDSPHRTRVVPEMRTAAYCEGCHQFNFPHVEGGQVTRYTEHPMQNTVVEFRSGARADTPGECLGCHGNTPTGHGFPGAHSIGALQHAVTLDLCRRGSTYVASVRNVGAGHAVPTGDLHRHMVLRLWRSAAPERLWETRIGRVFEADPAGGKRVVEDTSIPPGETRRWTVSAAGLGVDDGALNAELRYVYTVDEHPRPGTHPGEPTYATVRAVRLGDVPRCP